MKRGSRAIRQCLKWFPSSGHLSFRQIRQDFVVVVRDEIDGLNDELNGSEREKFKAG